MALILKQPHSKNPSPNELKKYGGKPSLPLIFGSSADIIIHEDLWIINTGRFNGLSVIVDDLQEMENLFTMGFFGKGCLSKKHPNFHRFKGGVSHRIIRERQWERRKQWIKDLNDADVKKEDDDEPVSKRRKVDAEGDDSEPSEEVLVVADSDEEDDYPSRLNPHLEQESTELVFESLHLTLEEAFFLSYALGSLQVIDLLGNLLSLPTLWRAFKSSKEDFVEHYVAYHYFRAKGWVVKPGLKFGGHFILYKKGPAFYHASYIVLVVVYDSKGHQINPITLNYLSTLNRLAESAFKEVLLCEVERPEGTESEFDHPNILPKFKVRENLIRRWIPQQNREES